MTDSKASFWPPSEHPDDGIPVTERNPEPDCPFCDIVAGRREAHMVMEAPSVLAFLDRRPLFPGHTLLIPREHHRTLPELPADLTGPYFRAAQVLAAAVQDAMDSEGTFVAINNVVSQSVPHLHLHVVPRRRGDGLRGFFWPRQPYESDRHMADVAQSVRARVAQYAHDGE